MSRFTMLQVVTLVLLPVVAMGATRCYDNLGCYDSGVYHALPQDPAHVRTQFRISCRNHTDDVIVDATTESMAQNKLIDNSCFAADRPTKFIVHGFTDKATANWVTNIRDLLLQKDDYNVIAVDWQHGANFPYEQALANTFLVAKQIALFVRKLETVQGLSPLYVHIIGHSLGAQIAGNAGRDVSPTRIGRISGLDPAEPYFGEFDDSKRLDASDAIFVDVIHTDGEKFTGTKGYGSARVQGHVDFFPNGGERQPGCTGSTALPGTLIPGMTLNKQLACSHIRAYELFAQSLKRESCDMMAVECDSWTAFEEGNCTSCTSGSCLKMGIDSKMAAPGQAQRSFYLSTTGFSPYCGRDFQVEIRFESYQSHAYGRLYLVLEGNNTWSNYLDFNRKSVHYHADDMIRHIVTSDLQPNDELSGVELFFEKGTGLSAIGTSDQIYIRYIHVTDPASGKRWRFCPGRGFSSGSMLRVNRCTDTPSQ